MTSATQGFQEYLCLDSRRHALHLCLSCPSALQTLGASHGTQDTFAFRLTYFGDAVPAFTCAVQFAAVTMPILLCSYAIWRRRSEAASLSWTNWRKVNQNGRRHGRESKWAPSKQQTHSVTPNCLGDLVEIYRFYYEQFFKQTVLTETEWKPTAQQDQANTVQCKIQVALSFKNW